MRSTARLWMGNPGRSARALRCGAWTAAGLAFLLVGPLPSRSAAQDQTKPAAPPPSSPSPAPPQDPKTDPARDAAREATRRRLEERDRAMREQAQRQSDEAAERIREAQGMAQPGAQEGQLPQNGQPAPVPGQPMGQPEQVAADQVGALADADGAGKTIQLNFPEPVDLGEFVNYVAKALAINIIVDAPLSGQTITFKAPVELPVAQLLPLLSRLLEDKGFALSRDPLGWYTVQPPANMPPVFEPGDLTTTKVIPTPLVRPSAIDAQVKSQLPGNGSNVRSTAIDELGVLIVTAPSRQLQLMERLIEEVLKGLSEQKLHRLQLSNVSAEYARERVLVLNGQLGGGGAATIVNPATPQGAVAAAGGGALSSLDQRLIVEQGNALVFRGRDDEFPRVMELIRLVDVVTPLIAKRYSAGSASQQVAETGQRMGLGSILSSSSGTGGGIGGFTQRGGRSTTVTTSTQDGSSVASSGFSVDEDTGSLIYFGTNGQHKIVEELVRTFNEQALSSRVEIQMYKLKHAKAESVVTVLQDLVSETRAPGTSSFLPGSRQQSRSRTGARDPNLGPAPDQATPEPATAEGAGDTLTANFNPDEISIVEDEDRNQVLVKAPARQQREIARIIDRLDQRLPQVYIEAQIVSVTATDDFNWTIESQISAGDFLIFSNFGLTGVPTGGDAQSPRTVPANRRGLTSAIIDEKYTPVVIRTLQENTDAKLVSSPRVLVNDNQEATIESIREEPFQSTSQNANTTITGQGGTATAGTVLTVTPQISEGGYLTLEYTIELSNFEGLPRTDGLQRPKQQERYESSVTIPSDSTIVVGGFTLDQQSESDSRIPILGDIPLIGNLFKDYSRNKRRTTIYVFITPTIMTDPNFLDLRLATEGPRESVGIDIETPDLEPVKIPITTSEALRTRRLPRNPTADRPPQ